MPRKMWLIPLSVVVLIPICLCVLLAISPINAGKLVIWCRGESDEDAFIGFIPVVTDKPWQYKENNGIGSFAVPSAVDPELGFDNREAYWAVRSDWSCPDQKRVIALYLGIHRPYPHDRIVIEAECDKNGCR